MSVGALTAAHLVVADDIAGRWRTSFIDGTEVRIGDAS